MLDRQQSIRKVLINSMYGVLGNKFFHFYDLDNARAITRAGRVLIRYLSDISKLWFKSKDFKSKCEKLFGVEGRLTKICPHILTDTDSVYLSFEEVRKIYAPDMDTFTFAQKIEPMVNKFYVSILDDYAKKRGIKNIINFKREGIISQQIVLAKKKYISEILQKEATIYSEPKISATGIEIKRSSTPTFCKKCYDGNN